jgi:hypothetical protein
MSGGYWDYKDMHLEESVDPYMIPVIIKAVQKSLHEIDWAESGDSLKEDAKSKIYNIIRDLGNELYG